MAAIIAFVQQAERKIHERVQSLVVWNTFFLYHTLINVPRCLVPATAGQQNLIRQQMMGIKVKWTLPSVQTQASLFYTNHSFYTSRHTLSCWKALLTLKAAPFFLQLRSATHGFLQRKLHSTFISLLSFTHKVKQASINISCIPWHIHWRIWKQITVSEHLCAYPELCKGQV